MSLVFPCKKLRTKSPVWTLGGRQDRPKSLVFVSIVGPTSTDAREGLLDTGADDTVFPEQVATIIGIDLSLAAVGEAIGMGGVPLQVRYAEVKLRITDGKTFLEWPARVAFTAATMRRPLLGFAGFLQFFDANFRGAREEVELTANHLFPGP
jgi:hypothetical protein